ncbi:MAG TPA: dihydrofolate reductase family protein [Pseudonocardiaceae bacterium]|nr:dihydrofolate reductase family protein [Pseudonocardiaceae bacterium]
MRRAIALSAFGEAGDLLASLVAGGVRSLLVDGGSSLAGSFLESGLVDQAITYLESGGPSSAGSRPRTLLDTSLACFGALLCEK